MRGAFRLLSEDLDSLAAAIENVDLFGTEMIETGKEGYEGRLGMIGYQVTSEQRAELDSRYERMIGSIN